jgi:rubrerythrin
MVGEAFAGLSAIKAAFDLAKGLKNISDATTRNAVAIELQEKILAAQAAQSGLVERVRELEKEVAHLETWEGEKLRYDLKNVGFSAYAYMLKPTERGVTPPHWVCTNCYEHKHIAIMQYGRIAKVGSVWRCPSCKNEIDPGVATAKWLD